MNRAYPNRINWENEPSTNTPINETNLNKMDSALYEIDGRVVGFDLTKANQSDLLQTIKTLTYNTTTGVFVFEFWNGGTYTVDLNIEKIPVSFSMSESGVITMVTADGTTYTCDISTLIKLYTFVDSSEIDFTTTTDASGNKTITAQIKAGSITGDKLQPNYLADCVDAKNSAETAATSADADALVSEGYAVGKQNGTDVPSTSPYYHNNAKWYSEQANPTTLANLTDTDIDNPQTNQPLSYDGEKWINNSNLMLVSSGEKTSWNGAVSDIEYNKQKGYLSRNLLKLNLNDIKTINTAGTWNGNNYTINNVTFELLQTDGVITAIKANGQATSNAVLTIRRESTSESDRILEKNSSYIGSGCPIGGDTTKYRMRFYINSETSANDDFGSGVSFTTNDSARLNYCQVWVSNGYNAQDLMFYPMIQFATSQSSNFTPYTLSNNELNAKKSDITAIGTDESGRTTASKAYAVGEHFYKDGKFCTAKTAIASGATFTLNTNYVEGSVADAFNSLDEYAISDSSGNAVIQAKTNSWMIVFAPNGLYTLVVTTAYQWNTLTRLFESGSSASYDTSTGKLTISGVGNNRHVLVKRNPL